MGAIGSATVFAATLLEVDDLARFTTSYGDGAGERVLVAVADALGRERQGGELVIRYGADEFLVVARGTNSETALDRAGRMVEAARDARLSQPLDHEHISVSAAVTVTELATIPFARLAEGLKSTKSLGKNLAHLVE
ncbi:MAG TPA: diguanylate cyclase [Acidimicrobiales bacterium]|nr:diguanylate cyclase [Acidimicrobiales bacterium]